MKNFIIHLPSIPASLESATKLKQDLEQYDLEVELTAGVRGDDAVQIIEAEGRVLHPVGLKGPIDPSSPEGRKVSAPGVKGCFLSHYSLWKWCVDLNEPIAIWEDDIIISRGYYPVDFDEVLILALGHPTKSVRWMHLLEEPSGDPEALEYNSPSMPGACGYAITPVAAKKLVDMYQRTFTPADNAINRNVVTMQIHSYIMGIASVDGKKSLTKTNAWNKNKI
jgi:GR25 family glycosyltransferase involved in LPS biosynthesis